MRIVDVNEYYAPAGGGVRTYIDAKMALLGAMGHELIVIAPGRETRVEERAGGAVHYVRSPALPFDRNYGLFWDRAVVTGLLDRYDPCVVENCSPWKSAWFVGDWRGRALKSFFMHNDNLAAYPQRWLAGVASPARVERAFGWYTRYMARFLSRYDCVLTNGPALEKRLRARGVRVDAAMPLGVERGTFAPALRDERLRRALLAQCGLGPEARLLLGVGRHHGEKQWDVVIDAAERAGAARAIGLVLFGHGRQTAALARQVAGSPHIRLFAPVYDRALMARIMASCDAYIHGADGEPFGLVVSEALASGAPLVVPDTGGAAEVAAPAYAETYRGGDARAAAAAIERLFARDPATLSMHARRAAARVPNDAAHVAALTDYYAAAIDHRRRRVA